MRTSTQIINGFINAASLTHFTKRAAPLVDEDLAFAFDAAETYATKNPDANNNQAHCAGHEYMNALCD